MGDSVLATSSIICLFKMQCSVSENQLCGVGWGGVGGSGSLQYSVQRSQMCWVAQPWHGAPPQQA